MKYLILIIAVLSFLGACSSNSDTERTNGGTNSSTTNANSANANAMAATNANPPIVPYNGVQNLDPNAFNATSDNLKVVPYQPKKDEMSYGSRTAPDESLVTVGSRGKEFVETRTFKNHETLAKVEKIMDGETTKYKVFLKNGKVVEAPAEKMTNFAAMAPITILNAVGMTSPPETTAPGKPEGKEAPKQ